MHAYADKPSFREHLTININQVMAEIAPNMCQKVIEINLKKISACNISRGGYLNDAMFQTTKWKIPYIAQYFFRIKLIKKT